MAVDRKRLEALGREVLLALGENPDREGLADTPRRWAAWWCELVDADPGTLATAFAAPGVNQMVVVSGMRVWSVCEHHLLPFWCDVAVGYMPQGQVLGLSKFARIARKHAGGLQVQERLAEQIADEVARLAASPDVAVVLRGEHLCMTMRGVRTGARMSTSVMRGLFLDSAEARAEFLRLANGNGGA